MVVKSFWLKENLVPLLVREAHHLVLDRGAIARPGALDLAGIHRRTVQIGPDHRMPGRAGIGDAAGDLRGLDPLGEIGHWRRRVVARLAVEAGPVDGPAVQPRRRPGLEPAQRESQAHQGF
jgi:hypothetical protein